MKRGLDLSFLEDKNRLWLRAKSEKQRGLIIIVVVSWVYEFAGPQAA